MSGGPEGVEERLARAEDRLAHALARVDALEQLVQGLLLAGALGADGVGARGPLPDAVLVVGVAGRRLALPLRTVREVVRMAALRPLPARSAALEGLLDLRGEVVPVIDLRAAFACAPLDDDLDARIVVVDLAARPYGFKVDDVEATRRLAEGELHPPPASIAEGFVSAVASTSAGLALVLDPEAFVAALAARGSLPETLAVLDEPLATPADAALAAPAGAVEVEADP